MFIALMRKELLVEPNTGAFEARYGKAKWVRAPQCDVYGFEQQGGRNLFEADYRDFKVSLAETATIVKGSV
jgi:hypothetical protein